MGYPIMLDLKGRACVVVGGGKVAARKVAGLLTEGARVAVISPTLVPELAARQNEFDYIPETYTHLDGLNPFLVFAATNQPEVNAAVIRDAQRIGALVNSADAHPDSDFSNMSTFRRGVIQISIGTGGASPALTAHLRRQLEAAIGEEYALLSEWLGEAREEVKSRLATPSERETLWRRVLESDILLLLRAGEIGQARQLFDRLREE